MDRLSDIELLRQYVEDRSEEAFAALVARHVGLVFSAALRQVRNPHLAQEVTQATFIVLARKAGRLGDGTVLSAWLYRTARFAAADALKAQARRIKYEQEAAQMEFEPSDEAWAQVAPDLDQAVSQLCEKDRAAVLLRFFEKKSLREVGVLLGTNEDSAQKRVSRALARLREYFARRGVILSGAGLGGLLMAHGVQAAPAIVASTTAEGVFNSSASSVSTLALAKGTLKMILLQKLQSVAAIAAVIAITATAATVVAQKAGRAARAKAPAALADRTTPTGALRYLAEALARYEGDKVADSYLIAGPGQDRFVRAMAEVVTREGQLIRAVEGKFGEKPMKDQLARRGGTIYSFNFGQDGLDFAEEQMDGASATVRLPNRFDLAKSSVITLRRTEGIWKVYSGPASSPPGEAEKTAASLERISRMLKKTTAEVSEGHFKDFAEVMRVLQGGSRAALRP